MPRRKNKRKASASAGIAEPRALTSITVSEVSTPFDSAMAALDQLEQGHAATQQFKEIMLDMLKKVLEGFDRKAGIEDENILVLSKRLADCEKLCQTWCDEEAASITEICRLLRKAFVKLVQKNGALEAEIKLLKDRVAELERRLTVTQEYIARIQVRQFLYRLESFLYKHWYPSTDISKRDFKIANLKERLHKDTRPTHSVAALDNYISTKFGAVCDSSDSLVMLIKDVLDGYQLLSYAHPAVGVTSSASLTSSTNASDASSGNQSQTMAVAPRDEAEFIKTIANAQLADVDANSLKTLAPFYFTLKAELGF